MDFHLGILHLAHLLANVDGQISATELRALNHIQQEEGIDPALIDTFLRKAETAKEIDLYRDGIAHINLCSEVEKIRAFVHLYRLAEADTSIHVREVRFLLYGVKSARLNFNDVLIAARRPFHQPVEDSVIF